jgi:nitrite reductase/ring-hydroxylating ferredoxin subunit
MNQLNNGRGQEITGVTLPADGNLKGWEFGDQKRLVCANVNGKFYALQGDCPRCGFDLWKGDLLVNDPAWDTDVVACPTCSTTYAVQTGKHGPPLKRGGLAGVVGGLAKTATANEANRNAKAFIITREEDGRVYCKER